MRGTKVVVTRANFTGQRDAHGAEIVTYLEPETVDRVLVMPSTQQDTMSRDASHGKSMLATQPFGLTELCNFTFPKTWQKSLRGAKVYVPYMDTTYSIIGDPHPIGADCPTRWNYSAQGVRIDG